MKIYESDQVLPVNSKARKAEWEVIPPWSHPGRLRSKALGSWPVDRKLRLTGGTALLLSANSAANVGLVLVKHNAFVKNVVVAQCTFTGNAILERQFTMEPALTSVSMVAPLEQLQLVIFVTGNGIASDLTVQFEGEVWE